MTTLYFGTTFKDRDGLRAVVHDSTVTARAAITDEGEACWEVLVPVAHGLMMGYSVVAVFGGTSADATATGVRVAAHDGWTADRAAAERYAAKELAARKAKRLVFAGPRRTKIPTGMSIRQYVESL